MDILQKARILGDGGKYDSCGPKACEVKVNEGINGIYTAKAEHKECRIFKTLMDNSCKYDCKYCQNASCKKKKVSYKPQELGRLFHHLTKKLAVNGLFLSSGVSGDVNKVTEKMLEAIRIVRYRYKFRGYIHFKVLPGTSYELIKQASELSSRMSINIEAPNVSTMQEYSDCKDFKTDILKRQAWISKMNLPGGQATQMIVSKFSTDQEIIKMAEWEYKQLKLKRVYYSSFRPVKGTPLENLQMERLERQNHLYNVDFLMNKYGYKAKEFREVMNEGMLPNEDPKLALAKANFDGAIDINEASYEELIRIPGIGPKTARKIALSKGIKKYEDLHKFGGWVERAKPFIKVNGRRQKMLTEF